MGVQSRSLGSAHAIGGSIKRVWHSMLYDSRSSGVLLAVLALYFATRLIFFDWSYLFWDEAVYVLNSYAALGQNYYNELWLRPPLVSVLLVPFLWFSKSDAVIKFYPILLNAPAVLSAYLLGRELDQKVAVISALLLTLFPFHILSSRWVMTDSVNIVFVSMSMLYQYRGLRDRRSADCVLGGLFLGLAILTKFTSVYMAAMSVPLFICFGKRNLRNVSYIVLASALTLSPYLSWNYLVFHDPIKSFLIGSGVIQGLEPVSPQFTAWTIMDFYGPVLVLMLVAGICLTLKNRNRYLMFQLYCFCSAFLLYLILIDTQVAKPPSVEWEVERFLLPALPFSLVIIGYVIRRSFKPKMLLGLALAVIIISGIPSYQRAYTPAVDFENGLRTATKEMGIYISQNTAKDSLVYCSFNWPSIAYYAQRRLLLFSSDSGQYFFGGIIPSWNSLSDGDYLVIFSGKPPSLNESLTHGLKVSKVITSGIWNLTLLQK